MADDEQGVYQTPAGERELRVYENLDLLLTELPEAYRDYLWHVVWRLTGSDPAAFRAARRWLKMHDPAGPRSSETATVDAASSSVDAGRGE